MNTAPNPYGAATTVPGTFVDAYGRAHGQMAADQVGETTAAYGSSNGVVAASSDAGGNAVWAGPYDPSIARR